jgi:hypothetical protein
MYLFYNHIRRAVERDERNEHAEDRYEQEPLHLVTHHRPELTTTPAMKHERSVR